MASSGVSAGTASTRCWESGWPIVGTDHATYSSVVPSGDHVTKKGYQIDGPPGPSVVGGSMTAQGAIGNVHEDDLGALARVRSRRW